MTLLERLQSHKGGLIKLKTELFWYDGRGHDEDPGRFCLLLDAVADTAAAAASSPAATHAPIVALLLIEGQPQWVWVAEQDVEVIDEAR